MYEKYLDKIPSKSLHEFVIDEIKQEPLILKSSLSVYLARLFAALDEMPLKQPKQITNERKNKLPINLTY